MATSYGAHRLPRQIEDKKVEIRAGLLAQVAAIADVPTAGAATAAANATAINAILAALRSNDIVATA